jgi:two-component system phosphate regulon sensor histidine kinase PhoR
MKRLTQLRSTPRRLVDRLSRTGTLLLGIGLSVAVIGLLALSYPSVADRHRNSQILAERRAEVLLALLSGALDRDMKAAQVSVLLPLSLPDPLLEAPTDLRDTVARAFIRFPYPESFFLWTGTAGHEGTFYLFNRTDRPPSWDPHPDTTAAFPAVLQRNPARARPLVDAIRKHAAGSVRDVVFECVLNDEPYQVVAKLVSEHASEVVVVGFTVNMRWTREHYFNELAGSVLRVRNESAAASILIKDENGRQVAGAGWRAARGPALERQFSPVFFDPILSSTFPAGPATDRFWTARVEAAADPMAIGARLSVGGTYLMLAAMAVASVLGMLFTARTVTASAELAERRSEFISTVTHELKTPLASIRLLAETLGDGRYESVDTIRDYAGLLSREAWRLTRLIDNLLAYASVSSARTPSTERHEVAELLDEVVAHFHPQLSEQSFEVTIEVPPDLPRVRGDRTALLHALDNLVDNAIKYSAGRRTLTIRTWAENGHLAVEVADRGQGIAPEELPHVFEKFYRGRGVRTGGSGLGLAIVKRVVDDHRGTVEMSSVLGEGTIVRLVLPREVEDA